MRRIEYKSGDKIGECIYLYDTYSNGGLRRASFKCKCGNEFESLIKHIKSKGIRSCGCIKKSGDKNRTHGMYKTKIYRTWKNIKTRCFNHKIPGYNDYGGRGITICNQWRRNFISFYNYLIILPNALREGYSIDRINNNGNYEPGNVQWATTHEQAANTRKSKNNKYGYTGVIIVPGYGYGGYISVHGKRIWFGTFNTPGEAAIARNNYIIKNKLYEYPIQKIKT